MCAAQGGGTKVLHTKTSNVRQRNHVIDIQAAQLLMAGRWTACFFIRFYLPLPTRGSRLTHLSIKEKRENQQTN
jgi:hypothetical protein